MENQDIAIQQSMDLGKVFAESGVFPDIKSAAQGCVKILAGRELGLTPIQSLSSFYFVNGKLGITSNTVAAKIKSDGKYDYHVEVHNEQECTIIFFRIGKVGKEDLGRSTFTFKDGAKAGLVNKDNWKNYPRNMLFSRALMNGVRWYCPDAIHGFIYSVEELNDIEPEKNIKTVTLSSEGEVSNGTPTV